MREAGRRVAPRLPRLHGSLVGAVLGAVLAGSLALAGCGDDDDASSDPTTTLPPIGTTTTAPVVTTAPPVDPTATTAPVATGEPGTYTVVAGDTLGAIANRYGVSLQDLAIANGFDPNSEDDMRTLQIGDVLTIPGAGGAETTTAPPATTSSAP